MDIGANRALHPGDSRDDHLLANLVDHLIEHFMERLVAAGRLLQQEFIGAERTGPLEQVPHQLLAELGHIPPGGDSHGISIIAASLPSAATSAKIRPSSVGLSARFSFTLPTSRLRISIALASSPPASVSALLTSIIGRSVLSRSALTAAAVISAIATLSLSAARREIRSTDRGRK